MDGESSAPTKLPRRDATANPPRALQPLFAELATRQGIIPLADLESMARGLSLNRREIEDVIRIDVGGYVRTLVFERENVEVLVMAWLPGQRSPIHDHEGSGCAVRVVSGCALERNYTKGPAGLVELRNERRLAAGGVTTSFDQDVHSFGNAALGPASVHEILVTIHFYSPTNKYVEA